MKRECCPVHEISAPVLPLLKDTVNRIIEDPILICYGRADLKLSGNHKAYIDSLLREVSSQEELWIGVITDSQEYLINKNIAIERAEIITSLLKNSDSTVSLVIHNEIRSSYFEDSINCKRISDIQIKPKSKVINLNNKIVIRHEYNSAATIDNEMVIKALDELLVKMKQENLSIRITGYTDNDGTEKENFVLSRQRALAIKRYLVKNGANPLRILTEYKGALDPVAANDTEEGRSKNRRSEIEVLK